MLPIGCTPTETTAPSDVDLLLAWRAGDGEAGEALFERHYDRVARFFLNKASTLSEQKDLIQNTFLACVESVAHLREKSSFRAYLLGIAKNVWLLNHRRHNGPRNHAALSSTHLEDQRQSPSDLLVEREEERMLLAALRRLDPKTQLLLELRYWEQLKHHEMAYVLEVPISKVKNWLRSGKQELEQLLAELASSPQKLQSTLTNLDVWAEQLRQKMPHRKRKPLVVRRKKAAPKKKPSAAREKQGQ